MELRVSEDDRTTLILQQGQTIASLQLENIALRRRVLELEPPPEEKVEP